MNTNNENKEKCYFIMNVKPTINRDEKGRTCDARTGSFSSTRRMAKDSWMKTKAFATYFTSEDIEDGLGFGQREAGWDYEAGALFALINNGRTIVLEGIECNSRKELYNAIEELQRRAEAYADAQSQKS